MLPTTGLLSGGTGLLSSGVGPLSGETALLTGGTGPPLRKTRSIPVKVSLVSLHIARVALSHKHKRLFCF